MRKLFVLATVVLIALAGCTPVPSPAPVASSTPVPSLTAVASSAAASPDASAQVSQARTPTPSVTAAPGATTAPNDRTKPSLTIAVDPPQIDWDSQSVVTVRASDPAGVKELTVLLGDQVLATGEGEELQVDFIPGAIDGLRGGTSYSLVARATDVAGNTAEASASIQVGPEPADTPSPATPAVSATGAAAPKTPTPAPTVSGTDVITSTDRGTTSYRVTEIQIPTYPYADYLKPATDPARADYPVLTLDQAAYSASNPQPQMKPYRLLVLENRYLRLGILPDLGGRIYECIFKPTGSNEFYSNTVIKPTSWGPASPPGAAWWLSAGGLEWGFPVEEHGYEFGTVWGFDHVTQDDGGVMITVFTKTGPQKPYAVVDIILPPDTAYFVVQPRVVNPLGGSFQFKFWEDALLAPGKANSVSPDLRLIFPASQVTVHSAGDPSLPQPGATVPWPGASGRDLSRLGNWPGYLGVFAAPPTAGFAAVYDPGVDEGMVRVFPANVAKGVKLFAPRGSDGLDPGLWTDDGSTYVELHGGFTSNFDEWVQLGPGQEATWSEYWYPVAKIGGVTFANDRAALSLAPDKNTTAATAAIAAARVRLGLFPTTAITGRLTVTLPGDPPRDLDVQLSPDQPLVQELPLNPAAPSQGEVQVTLVDTGGETVFDWTGAAQLR